MQLVSIIIPYFQKKNYLLSCINSILTQEYSYFEVIIIDDECSKESKLFLESIRKVDKKKRIKIIYNTFNIGAGRSRNIGIKISKGNYIAFLDADDQWHKDKLKKQILFMKKKNILISHTSYSIVDDKNSIIGFSKARSQINYKELINSCDIGLSTVVISSKIKKQIIFPALKTKEDYVLWLKLVKKYSIFGIKKSYTKWRKLRNSSSSSLSRKIIDAFYVFYCYEKYNVFKSMFLVLNLCTFAIKKKHKQYSLVR